VLNTYVLAQVLHQLGLMISAFATIAFACRFDHRSGQANILLNWFIVQLVYFLS